MSLWSAWQHSENVLQKVKKKEGRKEGRKEGKKEGRNSYSNFEIWILLNKYHFCQTIINWGWQYMCPSQLFRP
jgi:hypothetical protein